MISFSFLVNFTINCIKQNKTEIQSFFNVTSYLEHNALHNNDEKCNTNISLVGLGELYQN